MDINYQTILDIINGKDESSILFVIEGIIPNLTIEELLTLESKMSNNGWRPSHAYQSSELWIKVGKFKIRTRNLERWKIKEGKDKYELYYYHLL